ncbi:MAG: terminase B [Bacillota bacterium]|nr:MAG: terminase B [Bacillota bacterium]
MRASDAIRYYRDHPVEWVRDIVGVTPEDYQAAALQDLAAGDKVAIRSGHGVGKTAVEAWAVLWFLSTRPFPKVPCTAPTEHQLYDLLWAELAKWLSRSKIAGAFTWTQTKVFANRHPERWFAVARTSNKPENMQGFHEDHLLFVVDEVFGVADSIMAVVAASLTGVENKLLIAGNPTRLSGYAYDAFHSWRQSWSLHHVNAETSARVSRAWLENMARDLGRDSDLYRVRVLGEFPRGEASAFIDLETCELAVARFGDADLGPATEPFIIGVDVARFGDDETVLAVRQGRRLRELRPYRKQDTMETTGRVVAAAREIRAANPQVPIRAHIDDTGLGGGVTDRLVELRPELAREGLSIEIVPCTFGGAGDDYYADSGAVMWAAMRDWLKEGAIPDDPVLVGQLSSRRHALTSKGKIRLESKDDMRRRGLRSPDRADALALTFWPRNASSHVTASAFSTALDLTRESPWKVAG